MSNTARLRAWFRRVFFWLDKDQLNSTEQIPDMGRDHALVLSVTQPRAVPTWRQMRYATRVFQPNEKLWFVLAACGSALFLATGVVLFSTQHMSPVPAFGGTYTEAIIGAPQALNPVDAPANDADADLVSLIYSGLFKMNGTEPVPDLAEKYEWSQDGKILTVTLRDNAKFQNDQPVTADDVVFTVESIQDTARNSLLAPLFRGVTVVSVDNRTAQFTLDQPDATFPIALCVGILPIDVWQDVPAQAARLANANVKPIGSGPYRVKSFTRDNLGQIKTYTLERYEGYYGIKPHIKNIVFEFFPDINSAQDAIKSDLVDGLAFVPPLERNRFSSTARWSQPKLEIPQQAIAFFNLKDKLLSDARVRQALVLAISRQDLVDALDGQATPNDTAYPFLSTPSSTQTDLEAARKLLDAAGWALPNNDTVRVYVKPEQRKPGVPITSTPSSTKLTLEIITPDEADLVKVAEAIKRQWSLLGIQVTVSTQEQKTVLRRSTRDRDAQVVLWNVLLSSDQDLFPIWWSGQAGDRGMNFSALADKEVDTFISATKSASTTAMLAKARADLSNTINKRYAAAFLLRPAYSYVVSTRVKGVQQDIVAAKPSDRFNALTEWYVKTGWVWK